jgi:hypothetical protein
MTGRRGLGRVLGISGPVGLATTGANGGAATARPRRLVARRRGFAIVTTAFEVRLKSWWEINGR